MPPAETHDLENVLDDLAACADEADGALSLGRALDVFARRSFGALLTIIAVVAALPVIGAIPGVSILTGTLLILVAGQFLLGRGSPWIPQRLRDLSIAPEKMKKAVEIVKPYAGYVDAVIRPRLAYLTDQPAARAAIAVMSIFLALLFYPMAVIPGGVWVPALSVMALGLALVARDGLLAIIGAAGAVATLALLWLVL